MTVSRKRLPILIFALATFIFFAATPQSEAQGLRGRRFVRPVFVGGFYYADPFWFDAYQLYPYPYGPYPPYGYSAVDPGSAIRIEATPKEAAVYVDGYYAGIVDDFDGMFQRLRVAPGEHEITLYREGYRTARQKIYLTPDSTFKIRYNMDRLAAAETSEPPPATAPPAMPPPPVAQAPQGPPPPAPRGPMRRRRPPNAPPPGNAPTAESSYGTLAIRVQPASANVLVDGERWQGPNGQDRLLVEVSEGPHRVEIQKDGYETFSSDVQVRRGETTPLNVSLRTRQ